MKTQLLAQFMQSAPVAFSTVANGIAFSGFYSSSTIKIDDPQGAIELVARIHVNELGPSARVFCGTIEAVAPAVDSKGGMAVRMFAVADVDDPAIASAAGTGIEGEVFPPSFMENAQMRQTLEGLRRIYQLDPSRRLLARVDVSAELVISSTISEAHRRRLVDAVLGSIYRRFEFRIRYVDSKSLIATFVRPVVRQDAESLEEEISIICPEAFTVASPLTVAEYIVQRQAFWLWWD